VAHAPPRIGLALGSGSARGWSHIGVIRAAQAIAEGERAAQQVLPELMDLVGAQP